jgi:phosphatidylinositol alpha-1,6-mannosyltransferase
MTILLISEVFPPKTGGSGRWFWEIYRRLARDQVAIAAGEDPRQQAFDETHDLRLERMPLQFRSWGLLGGRALKEYWRAARQLRQRINHEGVDQVHCGKCLPEGLLGLALKWWCGLPYSCYVHGEELNLASGSRELRWLTRTVLARADRVIANSRNTARLGWDNRRVILTVGRLQKRKGQDLMIRALPAIREAIPDVLYVIAGDGEERASLTALVEETGVRDHVQILGEIPDDVLIRCYQQCDLFALPNREVSKDIEGFGMVLLEAQACGKPVIAGASGGTSETMRIPDTGHVVPCDRPQELAALAADMLTRPARLAEMGRAARSWIVQHFDWETLAQNAAQLFQRNGCLLRTHC